MNIAEIDENISVVSEQTEPAKTPSANPDDLATLLAGYNEPAKVETPPTSQQQAPQQPSNNGAPNWYGNPAYYQRGKKKGTLRPNGQQYRPAVNMSVNPSPAEISGDIISGALFLTIINILMPMLFSVINNMVSKHKVAFEDLQIDDKTLKQLDGLSEKALKHIKIEANPVGVLAFTMVGLYAMQFMTVKMLKDVKPKLHGNNGTNKMV